MCQARAGYFKVESPHQVSCAFIYSRDAWNMKEFCAKWEITAATPRMTAYGKICSDSDIRAKYLPGDQNAMNAVEVISPRERLGIKLGGSGTQI